MDNVECPHCERNVLFDDWYEEVDNKGNFDQECPHCNEEFEIHVEHEPSFSSAKIVRETCIECKEIYRHTGTSHPRPEKYREIPFSEYNLCGKCYMKLITEDMRSWKWVNKDDS